MDFSALVQNNLIIAGLQGLVIYIGLVWLAIVLWVTRDIFSRTQSLIYQVFSILLVILLTPVFGLILYLLLRPARTLFEQTAEELQLQILSAEAERQTLMLSKEQEADTGHRKHSPVEKKTTANPAPMAETAESDMESTATK